MGNTQERRTEGHKEEKHVEGPIISITVPVQIKCTTWSEDEGEWIMNGLSFK